MSAYKPTPKGPAIVDVYVDDLVLYGSKAKGGLGAEIAEVRKHIRMDDPAPMGRYLGVNHRTSVMGPVGNKTSEVEFDMIDFSGARSRHVRTTLGVRSARWTHLMLLNSTTQHLTETWKHQVSWMQSNAHLT